MNTTSKLALLLLLFPAGFATEWFTRRVDPPNQSAAASPPVEVHRRESTMVSPPDATLTQQSKLERLTNIIQDHKTSKVAQRRAFEVLSESMNAAEIEAALNLVAKDPKLEMARWPLLWHWVGLDGPKAFQYAMQNEVEVQKVAEAWAELDPAAAKAAALVLKDWKLRQTSVIGVALGMSRKEPAAACELLQEVPGIEAANAYATIFPAFSKPNHKSAFEILAKMNEDHFIWAYSYLLDDWTTEDPEGAAEWANSPAGERFQKDILSNVERVRRGRDLSGGVQQLYAGEQGKPATEESYLSANTELDGAVAAWIDRDWDEATKWLFSLPEREQQRLLDGNPGFRMAYIRPEVAMQAIVKMAPGKGRDKALSNVARIWAWSDPLAAIQWVRQQSPQNQMAVLGPMITHLNMEEGLQLVSSFPVEVRQRAVEGLIDGHVTNSYAPVSEWIAKQPDGKEKDDYAVRLTKQWMDSDEAMTLEWINSLSPSSREVAKRVFEETKAKNFDALFRE